MKRVIPAVGDLSFGFRANAAGPMIIGATGAAFFMRTKKPAELSAGEYLLTIAYQLFKTFWLLFAVFVDACLFDIHIVYIRKGAQPCHDVCEFFFLFFFGSFFIGQGSGKFSDFFYEPHKSFWSASFAVSLLVSFSY
jgi:hypothetical protein